MHAARILLTAILAALATVGWTDVLVWSHVLSGRNHAVLDRDIDGNLYFVYSDPNFRGRDIWVQKISPAGEVLWSKNFFGLNVAYQASIRSVTTDTNFVYVVAQDRVNGTGSTFRSQFVVLNRSNGNTAHFDVTSGADEYESVSSNGTQAALLFKSSAGQGVVRFYQTGTWTVQGSANLGNVASVAEVKIDNSNYAYAGANNSNGTVQLSRSSAVGGIAYQTTLDSANRTNERVFRLEVDLVANRVYAIGTADWSPTDQDVMIYQVIATSGGTPGVFGVRTSAQNDYLGDITVVPNGGVMASASSPTTSETYVVRRNAVGTLLWSTALSGTPQGERRHHGMDLDGNLVVASPYNTAEIAYDRINPVNGSVVRRQFNYSNPGAKPMGMRMDAAGTIFVHVSIQAGQYLTRYQAGRIEFNTPNQTGGQTTTAYIFRGFPTTGEQVWTLASSNPAVVSVPDTVTIADGASTKNFEMSLTPVSTATNVSINARYGGFATQSTYTVTPPRVSSIGASPQTVIGGGTSTGVVHLAGRAVAGGTAVDLASNKPTVASVPASVSVNGGTTSANFVITTYGVNANQGVVLSATTGPITRTVFMAVNAPSLTSISVNPTTLQGGATGSLTLNLNGIAPTGGFSIVLISGVPGTVVLPASTSILAGETTRTISIPTTAVTATTQVTVIATRSGIYKTTTLTVTP